MQHRGIQLGQQRLPWRHPIADVVQDSADFALRRLNVGGRRGRWGFDTTQSLAEAKLVDGVDQLGFAAGSNRYGFDHWQAKSILQCVPINAVATLLRYVTHVECYEHRPTELLQLKDQA